MDADLTYEELVEIARSDDEIVGLVLTGSRGRGFPVTAESDWDVRLVVRDDVRNDYRSYFGTSHGSTLDVVVLSLSEFEQAGEIGSDSAWDRYSYVHAKVVVDEPGRAIADLVAAKTTRQADVAHSLATELLDDYINSYYRAAKNERSGLAAEARLDAAESIPPLLGFLFAVHRRVRPFNRFLRWELDTHPLPGAAWAAESLLPRLEAILATGDSAEQQHLFRDVETLARANALGDVVHGWEPDLAWLRGS